MITNDDIIASARGWLGTRFHHQGRLKRTPMHKGGVDCLGLLVGIATELNLHTPQGIPFSAFDKTDYTHFPDSVYLRQQLEQILSPVPIADIIPGHILLLHIERNPQHLAVVGVIGNALSLIHAYAPARSVIEHSLDNIWQERIVAAYSLS